jgi:hypothetical protein
MSLQLSSEQVWRALEREIFAVLGMVTAKGEARTVGIVYTIHDRKLYIVSDKSAWKVRYIRQNPHVSLTVTIAKRIPFLPWIKIPAATITFSGVAAVHDPEEISTKVLHALLRGLELNAKTRAELCVLEVQPLGDFVTYGIGIPLMAMRHPEKARGRASVA